MLRDFWKLTLLIDCTKIRYRNSVSKINFFIRKGHTYKLFFYREMLNGEKALKTFSSAPFEVV